MKDYDNRCIIEGTRAKNLEATQSFIDFSKAFDSIHRDKIEQMLQAFGLSKESVSARIIFPKTRK